MKYADKSSRFLVMDGAMVHYREDGHGETLLLLHGAFSSLHTFDEWVEELQHHFKVIRVDLPGFGLTDVKVDYQQGIAPFVQFIYNFLDRLGVKNFHIAGSSLGGWVSWEFALRHPDRVKSMILLNSAGFMDMEAIPLPFKMAKTPIVGRIVKYVVRRNILEQFLRQVYYDESKVNERLVDRYYDLFNRGQNPEAFFNLVNGHFRDNTRKLKYLEIPTLIIWGEEDRWIPVKYAYGFHKLIPKSRLIIYENVGHIPMEEIPQMTVEDALQFLGVANRQVLAVG
jgi:pimeloyl-ACP methyl ester carboxylesterase